VAEPAKHDPSTSTNEAEFLPSFVDLYHECLTPMVRLARALNGSEVVAEDVVHDAFIRVHAH
jgi:DNA-directed RNA polymerase specialized sigma24 family protein